MAEFMVKTGLLDQFQTVDPTVQGEECDDKGAEIKSLTQCDGRRRMSTIRMQYQVHCTPFIQASAQAVAGKTGRLERRGRGKVV